MINIFKKKHDLFFLCTSYFFSSFSLSSPTLLSFLVFTYKLHEPLNYYRWWRRDQDYKCMWLWAFQLLHKCAFTRILNNCLAGRRGEGKLEKKDEEDKDKPRRFKMEWSNTETMASPPRISYSRHFPFSFHSSQIKLLPPMFSVFWFTLASLSRKLVKKNPANPLDSFCSRLSIPPDASTPTFTARKMVP